MDNLSLKSRIEGFIDNKSILILGFGREGRSTYEFLRQLFPNMSISISDSNIKIEEDEILNDDSNINFILGENYLSIIQDFELVFKSPGISFKDYNIPKHQVISSQTDLFLYLFSEQTIGVTGTKGKSTTVSLLKHVLDGFYDDVQLVGNIGVAALDIVQRVGENTIVVFEMSSHQLEFVNHSPKIAVLLNLYQEHLDHYSDYKSYRFAKWNIAKFQSESDCFIYCADENQVLEDIENQEINSVQLKYGFNDDVSCYFDFDKHYIKLNDKILSFNRDKFLLLGKHNLYNAMAVVLATDFLNLPIEKVIDAMMTFKALPHRLEYVAMVDGIKFYNDSISTIPQATIKALESVDDVKYLILGGFDRGIDYQILIDYLLGYKSLNIMLLGEVGSRLYSQLDNIKYFGNFHLVKSLNEAVKKVYENKKPNTSCLLSPAASSYDSFMNFEERGNAFKKIVLNQ